MKAVLFIVIGMVLMYVILTVLGKTLIAGYNAGKDGDEKINRPTADDLKLKGYDASEIASIIASKSYQDGTGTW